MWNNIKTWLSHITTEPDNKTTCIVRVLAIFSFLYAIGVHGWSIFANGVSFDITNFALGWSGMITTLGAALKLKTDTPEKE